MKNRIVIFGVGHMGAAIARGILKTGIKNIYLIDPDEEKLKEFSSQGVIVDTLCKNLLLDDILILAIPPQVFPSFTREAIEVREHPGLIISVMAGIRIHSIQTALKVQNVVRTIPNTPSEVFEGMTLFCKSNSIDEVSIDKTRFILDSFGQCVELQSEELIDPGTALCGGGPAFVAYFANALQRFGEQTGIGELGSRQIIIQVLRGTAALLEATEKPALQICSEVMTPGGTTERGVWHFDQANLNQTIIDALTQSSIRSKELGTLAENIIHDEVKQC